MSEVRTLAESGYSFAELDAIAVTMGPGLIGALLVGLSTAKGLAYALENRSSACTISKGIFTRTFWRIRRSRCRVSVWLFPAGTRTLSRSLPTVI